MIGMDHIASRAIREFRLRTIALRYSLLIVLLVVVVIFALSSPAFAVSTNVNTLLRAASIAAIMYVGATWVIASGEIDVSFMQVAAVSNMVVAAAVPHGWPMAIGLGIAIGFGIGLLNGVLVGLLRLPSLVITIMTGSLALSMAEAIGRGSSLSIADTGYVGYFVHFNLGAVPAVALLAAASYVLAWYLQERTRFRPLHLCGGAEPPRCRRSRNSGPQNHRYLVRHFGRNLGDCGDFVGRGVGIGTTTNRRVLFPGWTDRHFSRGPGV